ncbi:protein kinase [Dietzia aerolata]|uniref:serine/threonine-protein kinase n=1 Tax=Dietzia aerolata TaxID=595984 RepID=UPI003640EC06
MSLNSGAVLSDRYRLQRLIATGGMGQVWEADDSVLDRRVAVKILKPEFSSDPEFVDRFRSEAKVTARISHPGIATVYDYGQITDPASGSPLSYLVMELVVGEPLSDVLAREGQLPLGHTLDMLEQTGRALNAAHAIGLVHRDVKPGNILITPAGQVKLTDFGIAKSMGASAVTQTGMVVGTAQYISPEQAMGHHTTPAGDVYSLGVVGYECLAGRRPFVADSPVTIAMKHVRESPDPLPDSVPEPVRRVIAEAMVKDPAQRYPDGGAFADAVADVRSGRDPGRRVHSPPRRVPPVPVPSEPQPAPLSPAPGPTPPPHTSSPTAPAANPPSRDPRPPGSSPRSSLAPPKASVPRRRADPGNPAPTGRSPSTGRDRTSIRATADQRAPRQASIECRVRGLVPRGVPAGCCYRRRRGCRPVQRGLLRPRRTLRRHQHHTHHAHVATGDHHHHTDTDPAA